MVDTERKLHELLDNLVKRKERTNHQLRNSPRCELQIGDIKIKQVQKLMKSVLTSDRKCVNEIRIRIEIVKYNLQK